MKGAYVLGHVLIVFFGALAGAFLSKDFRAHVLELVHHLQSGNWEVVTDNAAIESIVRKKYEDSSKWVVSFAATSGEAFSLDTTSSRRDTIRSLGRQTLAESVNLRFNSTSLQAAYGDFLSSSLLELSGDSFDSNGDPLRRLADELQRRYAGRPTPIDFSLYEKAQQRLAALPNTETLKKAIKDYGEQGVGISFDFPAFEVASMPSDDAPGAWNKGALVLPQSGKCRAKVMPSSDPNESIEANLAFLPRILEVSLERAWISSDLLDKKSIENGQLTSGYFESDGSLRVIPERIWVLMPENAWIQADSELDGKKLRSWGEGNVCCKVTCAGLVANLSPTSFHANPDATFSMRRADQIPLLYAIISRRRAAP
ncbi:hypothetical protein ACNFH5_10270 [Pseudomonas sp. NY15435]|uniref:hypothetical protein n=1 Tax=Pseudomonas sp. NY15435 TaxID=3400358 RepID=UPI003A8823A5